jgi:hypothetical protein
MADTDTVVLPHYFTGKDGGLITSVLSEYGVRKG